MTRDESVVADLFARDTEVQRSSEPNPKETAFDSSQWNSAVGLGGGAGGVYGGRGGSPEPSVESYFKAPESGFVDADQTLLSTFAADVDTASYTNVRRLLAAGQLPPPDAVRLEEFVNAFRYGDLATASAPFAIRAEVAPCPWQPAHELVRLAVSTPPIDAARVPPCNLVFLIDVSGSMQSADKLPLLQRAFQILIDQLRPQDRVAIVTYAAGVSVPLESARGDERERIRGAVAELRAGGSTNGEGGIQRAYELAQQHRVTGVNRVILATDGDFNVGISSADELERFIGERKDTGIFLTVLGFGAGNLKDDRLERLADKGNGVYAFIDQLAAARRVLVEQFGASLMTAAKDVKLQAEFEPRQVRRWRLLGYDNRRLEAKDFRDDRKDGGELGAGHAVTALFEIERTPRATASGDTLLTLRIRFKPPEGDTARELSHVVSATNATPLRTGSDFRLAATAAAFALQLGDSPHRGSLTFGDLLAMTADLDRGSPDQRELGERIAQAAALAGKGVAETAAKR